MFRKGKVIQFILFIVFYGSIGKAQTITTYAGDSASGYFGDGGPATAAEITVDNFIALDAGGNLYIADYFNNRVREVNTSGIISTFAGIGIQGFYGDGGPASAAEFDGPNGLVADASGNVFISDQNNNRVRKVNTAGVITTYVGNGFGAPASGGYSGDGGQATDAEIFYPQGLYVDASGNLYLADFNNNHVRKVSSSGVISSIAGYGYGYNGDGGPATAAELYGPTDISLDVSGNVFIVDYFNNRIREVNTSGMISTFAGNGAIFYLGDGGPATAAGLFEPEGIAVTSSGNVFIGDQSNNRVREVNTSGIINTIAGIDTLGYSGDGGPATDAELNKPGKVVLDAYGNLFFVDSYNSRIRKIDNITGIDDIRANSGTVILFPNPSNGKFTLRANNQKLLIDSRMEVYNVLGEIICNLQLSTLNSQIDLSNRPNGIYFYRIVSETGATISSGKIELQK